MEHENLLSPDEKAVFKLLAGRSESRSSIVEKTGFGKTKVIGILKKLESEGICPLLRKRQGHPLFCCIKRYRRLSPLFRYRICHEESQPGTYIQCDASGPCL